MEKIEKTGPNSAYKIGVLPNWDLSDLYPGPKSKELESDLAKLRVNAENFEKKHQSNVAEMSGTILARCITEYEKIDEAITTSAQKTRCRPLKVPFHLEQHGERVPEHPELH